MVQYSEINSENLKDTFYFFGILPTFILSAITVIIAIKNRRNPLRENVYKEQLLFVSKLVTEFYFLHSQMTKINNGIEVDKNGIEEKIEKVFGVMFSNMHIGSNKVLIKSAETLKSTNLYLKNSDDNTKKDMFKLYFKNYNDLNNTIREEMGIDSLSQENEKLLK